MNYVPFRSRTIAAVGDVESLPEHRPRDDLEAFAFVSSVFVPAYRQSLEKTAAAGVEDAMLRPLSDLLETVLRDGGDETVDALAMRVIYAVFCLEPRLFEAGRPSLGPATLQAVTKFRAFLAKADSFKASVGV